jgi:hypothetical protein
LYHGAYTLGRRKTEINKFISGDKCYEGVIKGLRWRIIKLGVGS